nr:protein bicaudal C homolog 1-like [Penaeus vannamei]
MFDPSNYYAANLLLRTGGINGCNNNCILPNSSQGVGAKTGLNINAVSNGISGLKIACNDASCGTSSNSGSSLSSPTPSPRNPSPEQMVSCHMGTPSQQTNCNEAEQPSSSDINAISALLTDLDRRAPGCEKKQIEMAAQKLTLSDYSSKKVQAAKAMKEQVSSNPRTPTSNWSGYGFSKSLPGYIIRQKMQESRQMKAAHKEPQMMIGNLGISSKMLRQPKCHHLKIFKTSSIQVECQRWI